MRMFLEKSMSDYLIQNFNNYVILGVVSKKFQILQVHDILEFFWLPKVTSNISKRQTEHDGDCDKTKVYLKITDNFYHLVHVIIMVYGS